MASLPEGYTVSVTLDEDDRPCYAELRDSAHGIHVCDAIWNEQLGMWYNPSGHTPGRDHDDDDTIGVCATLKRWLEERNLRYDQPVAFTSKED